MLQSKQREWLALGFIIGALALGAYFAPASIDEKTALSGVASPEIRTILSLKTTRERSAELLNLLKRVGPAEAQEQLVHSGLPFTGETHLLVHTVGNYVYDQFGKEGLSYCKDYFLSACYHAVILNTLGDHGMEGVVEAMELCDEAGSGIVLSQCAHGAGHGFVAWHDYDLLKALAMCDELGSAYASTTSAKKDSLISYFPYFNCYDGVFMENMWGVHEGAPSPKRWVKESDPMYPCNDPRIPEKYLGGCWSNQATLAYQHFKGDLSKTAAFCDAVENPQYQEICYNNFARQIHPLTQGSLSKVKTLCSLATGEKWQNYCVLTNMGSYWSVGDRSLPFEICSSLSGETRGECLQRLASMINSYAKSPEEKQALCAKMPDVNLQQSCANSPSSYR